MVKTKGINWSKERVNLSGTYRPRWSG